MGEAQCPHYSFSYVSALCCCYSTVVMTTGRRCPTFMFGLQSFALLTSVDGCDPEVVLFGRVKVLDQELGLLLGHLHLRLLPTCSPQKEGEEEKV